MIIHGPAVCPVNQGVGERETETETERQRQTQRDRERQRQREREKERERESKYETLWSFIVQLTKGLVREEKRERERKRERGREREGGKLSALRCATHRVVADAANGDDNDGDVLYMEGDDNGRARYTAFYVPIDFRDKTFKRVFNIYTHNLTYTHKT